MTAYANMRALEVVMGSTRNPTRPDPKTTDPTCKKKSRPDPPLVDFAQSKVYAE